MAATTPMHCYAPLISPKAAKGEYRKDMRQTKALMRGATRSGRRVRCNGTVTS
jgi:hypothetical protein